MPSNKRTLNYSSSEEENGLSEAESVGELRKTKRDLLEYLEGSRIVYTVWSQSTKKKLF